MSSQNPIFSLNEHPPAAGAEDESTSDITLPCAERSVQNNKCTAVTAAISLYIRRLHPPIATSGEAYRGQEPINNNADGRT